MSKHLTSKTTPCPCPNCGYLLDAATAASDPTARPCIGDVTVCINCACLLIFSDNNGVVRSPTHFEVDAIKKSSAWSVVRSLQQSIFNQQSRD